jgi:hypothetical protein
MNIQHPFPAGIGLREDIWNKWNRISPLGRAGRQLNSVNAESRNLNNRAQRYRKLMHARNRLDEVDNSRPF